VGTGADIAAIGQEVIVIPRTIAKPRLAAANTDALLELIDKILDDGKAEDIVTIDLRGKSSIADYMVIATGRSQRQVAALSEHLLDALKDKGYGRVPAEGLQHGDWVLIDAGDIVVHVFRPEVRDFYNLEKMWGAALPEAVAAAS
jgi:ribosome-associated protein